MTPPGSVGWMLHPFVPLAERVIDALLDSDPVLAHYAGDHRNDHALPDLSPDAVRNRITMLRDASHSLVQLDTEHLTPQEQVDHHLLTRLVERQLFELEDIRAYEWHPLVHNPGPLLHGQLSRTYAPVADRLEAVIARLEGLPDALLTATGVLDDCPKIHLETAIGQFAGVAALIRDQVPAMAEQVPGLVGQSADAVGVALVALSQFDQWLKERLAEPGEGRDPRLGRPLWEARLWHTLDSELSAADVLDRAWANLDRVTEEIREAAGELIGADLGGDATVRRALDQIGADCPDDDTIVDQARDTLLEATAFVKDHDLVGLIDDPCEIMVMPEFARGIAVAYCDAPGPLETADVPTFYAISPTPAGWSPERVASFYREYNNQMIRNLTVHEAMPGHFLQLAHSRRYAGSSRTRALCRSGSFCEGWAVYAEEFMVGHGFGGLPVRIQQLKMQLRMSINAILDQLVHCEAMTEADGMRLMTERGFQEDGEAAGKWRRALLTSTQLSTYFVGYTEVSAAAGTRPEGRSLREWHDAMLSHGSPAPRHLKTLLSKT